VVVIRGGHIDRRRTIVALIRYGDGTVARDLWRVGKDGCTRIVQKRDTPRSMTPQPWFEIFKEGQGVIAVVNADHVSEIEYAVDTAQMWHDAHKASKSRPRW
jgi:hypothetical protein